MKNTPIIFTIALIFCNLFITKAQFISQQSGIWADGATWGNASPGVEGVDFPDQTDDLIIRAGHQITVNNLTDNGGPSIAPEGLNLINVGDGMINGSPSFPSGEDLMFYHIGNISIARNGTLIINQHALLAGTVVVEGTLTTVLDVVNLGRLNVTSHGLLNIGGNYIITGTSVTDIDATQIAAANLYIDHMETVIGGSNSFTLPNNIKTFNPTNNDPSAQICSNFLINCGGDCDPSIGGNQGVIVGASEHPICLEFFPVEFKHIAAKALNSYAVEVTWITATETNNDHFEIERSTDGVNWEAIGMVEGAGTSVQTNYYKWEDRNPTKGIIYYRIKQVDEDKTFNYSKQVAIWMGDQEEGVVLAPNIVQNNKKIQLLTTQTIQQIEIFDQYGQVVQIISNPQTMILMDFGTGVFNLRIKLDTGWFFRRVIVI
ncbi:T9SS type A sorting domain-containing protein [Aureispira anguillae]|uniref:T9SS type A sorting domain-containing protein n=1 Tax=Aureispira anguillae TaxID=2864201 RepID=A0A915VJS0_9BACT|nr:T9SS type A sorting domain-containing protein [Aureispira anguillae]BDS09306.1 T9SS type A sorting domain-containing protein [Aureispira anguillae]